MGYCQLFPGKIQASREIYMYVYCWWRARHPWKIGGRGVCLVLTARALTHANKVSNSIGLTQRSMCLIFKMFFMRVLREQFITERQMVGICLACAISRTSLAYPCKCIGLTGNAYTKYSIILFMANCGSLESPGFYRPHLLLMNNSWFVESWKAFFGCYVALLLHTRTSHRLPGEYSYVLYCFLARTLLPSFL